MAVKYNIPTRISRKIFCAVDKKQDKAVYNEFVWSHECIKRKCRYSFTKCTHIAWYCVPSISTTIFYYDKIYRHYRWRSPVYV